VQTKDQKYIPFLRPTDKPSIFLNTGTMEKYRPLMKPFYYDAAKYPTYMQQLGIKYPTVRTATTQVPLPTAAEVEAVEQQ
jgi:aminobenzoyl-glutamate utilization protein B